MTFGSRQTAAFLLLFTAGIILFIQIRKTDTTLRFGKLRRDFNFYLVTVAGIFGFLGLWTLASYYRSEGLTRIPSPFATSSAFFSLIRDGDFLRQIGKSFFRIFIGFSAASIAGACLGWLAGSFIVFNRLIVPTNSFLRYIPPTAFVTLLIVYFGIGEGYKYAVVFISVIFFIVQMTVDAVDDLDRRFLEMGLLSGMSHWQVFINVIVPGTLPRVLDILRINISGAWTFLVAAEVIGSSGGLGHFVAVSQRFGRIENLYVGILSFGIIGILTDAGLRFLSTLLFPWKR